MKKVVIKNVKVKKSFLEKLTSKDEDVIVITPNEKIREMRIKKEAKILKIYIRHDGTGKIKISKRKVGKSFTKKEETKKIGRSVVIKNKNIDRIEIYEIEE